MGGRRHGGWKFSKKICPVCGKGFEQFQESIDICAKRIIDKVFPKTQIIRQPYQATLLEKYHIPCYKGGIYVIRREKEEPHQEQALP